MIQINDRAEVQLTEETVGFPLTISASHHESLRIYDVDDLHLLISALTRVAVILNTKGE